MLVRVGALHAALLLALLAFQAFPSALLMPQPLLLAPLLGPPRLRALALRGAAYWANSGDDGPWEPANGTLGALVAATTNVGAFASGGASVFTAGAFGPPYRRARPRPVLCALRPAGRG